MFDKRQIVFLASERSGQVEGSVAVRWDQLVERLTTCTVGEKKGPAWMPVDMPPGARKKDNVRFVSYLVLDVDGQKGDPAPVVETVIERMRGSGWRCLLHTSYSHSPHGHPPLEESKGLGDRYRIVVDLSRSLDASEVQGLGLQVAASLGLTESVDKGKLNAGSLFFLPRCSEDRQALFQSKVIDGVPLPVDDLLQTANQASKVSCGVREEAGVPVRSSGTSLDTFAVAKTAARGNWPKILVALDIESGCLTNKHGPCPGCGGVDRFRFDDRDGDGTWLCGRGGSDPIAGDGFELLVHAGWSRGVALRHVVDYLVLMGLLAPEDLPDDRNIIEEAVSRLKNDAGALHDPDVTQSLRELKIKNPAEFARVRHQVKRSGTIPMKEFDLLADSIEPAESSASNDFFPEVTPWSSSVDGAQLLDEMTTLIRRYVIADQGTIDAAALWVVLTWFIDVVKVAPIANITAPEMRCGKSILLGVLSKMSNRPLPVSNIAPAALFRAVDLWSPTLLIDEVDSFLDAHDEARGIINAGFTRESAFVVRCVGDDHKPTRFNVWGAKALCGIGRVANTLEDRSIPLRLRRKKTGEKTEKLRRAGDREFEQIRAKLARFAEDNRERVASLVPDEIEGLSDRANDCWDPLLAIAMVAGGEWVQRSKKAAIELHGIEEEAPTLNVELLVDIKEICESPNVYSAGKIFSVDLLDALLSDDEKRWATYNRGKPITPKQIADRLKGFGIKSKQIRIGGQTGKRGYEIGQFRDAWQRYLPAVSERDSTSLQTKPDVGYSEFCQSTLAQAVDDGNYGKATNDAECRDVDHQKGASAAFLPADEYDLLWSEEEREENKALRELGLL